MFCNYGITFPQLIITIKNSKISLTVQTHFTFKQSADSLSSVLLVSELLIFLIPSSFGKGRGEVRTIFQNFQNTSNCSIFRQSYWLFNSHLELFLESRQPFQAIKVVSWKCCFSQKEDIGEFLCYFS